jgi:hypothetical protein
MFHAHLHTSSRSSKHLPFRLTTGDDKTLKKKYIVDERTYLPFVRPHEKGTAYIYLANGL